MLGITHKKRKSKWFLQCEALRGWAFIGFWLLLGFASQGAYLPNK
jgi:hypothetical protein